MRLLLLLILFCLPGEKPEPEELIGKPVSALYEWGWTCTFKQESLYRFRPREMRFCERKVRELEVVTDGTGRITGVSFQLKEVVRKNLYKSIGEKYGEATHMSVADKALLPAESGKDSISGLLSNPDFSAKDVALEENPLFLSWEKERYSLEVLNQYVVGTSLFQFKER